MKDRYLDCVLAEPEEGCQRSLKSCCNGFVVKYNPKKSMSLAGWEVPIGKTCDRGLENTAAVFPYTDRP